MADDLKEILEHGLSSPFWRWFVEHVEQEWGPRGKRYQSEMDKALDLADNDAAASQARQVRSGQKVILALLRAPEVELKRLTAAASAEDEAYGRASLSHEQLAGTSRRGGL